MLRGRDVVPDFGIFFAMDPIHMPSFHNRAGLPSLIGVANFNVDTFLLVSRLPLNFRKAFWSEAHNTVLVMFSSRQYGHGILDEVFSSSLSFLWRSRGRTLPRFERKSCRE